MAGGLAQEVAGEERDVRAENGLDEVEHVVIEEPLEQRGIGEVRHVHLFGSHALGQVREQLVEVPLERPKLGGSQHVMTVNEVTLVAEARHFRRSEPRLGAHPHRRWGRFSG